MSSRRRAQHPEALALPLLGASVAQPHDADDDDRLGSLPAARYPITAGQLNASESAPAQPARRKQASRRRKRPLGRDYSRFEAEELAPIRTSRSTHGGRRKPERSDSSDSDASGSDGDGSEDGRSSKSGESSDSDDALAARRPGAVARAAAADAGVKGSPAAFFQSRAHRRALRRPRARRRGDSSCDSSDTKSRSDDSDTNSEDDVARSGTSSSAAGGSSGSAAAAGAGAGTVGSAHVPGSKHHRAHTQRSGGGGGGGLGPGSGLSARGGQRAGGRPGVGGRRRVASASSRSSGRGSSTEGSSSSGEDGDASTSDLTSSSSSSSSSDDGGWQGMDMERLPPTWEEGKLDDQYGGMRTLILTERPRAVSWTEIWRDIDRPYEVVRLLVSVVLLALFTYVAVTAAGREQAFQRQIAESFKQQIFTDDLVDAGLGLTLDGTVKVVTSAQAKLLVSQFVTVSTTCNSSVEYLVPVPLEGVPPGSVSCAVTSERPTPQSEVFALTQDDLGPFAADDVDVTTYVSPRSSFRVGPPPLPC